MENILEVLGPIVIGILYLLGSFFSKKAEDENETPVPRERSRPDPNLVTQRSSRPVPHKLNTGTINSNELNWEEASDNYDNEMERQLKKIEATKREAARLLTQTSQANTQKASSPRKRKRIRSTYGSVRSSLKDPAAARKAFIYSEILGPPVSQRKTTSVPGLTS